MANVKKKAAARSKKTEDDPRTIEISFRIRVPEGVEIIAAKGPSNHYNCSLSHPDACCVCTTDIT